MEAFQSRNVEHNALCFKCISAIITSLFCLPDMVRVKGGNDIRWCKQNIIIFYFVQKKIKRAWFTEIEIRLTKSEDHVSGAWHANLKHARVSKKILSIWLGWKACNKEVAGVDEGEIREDGWGVHVGKISQIMKHIGRIERREKFKSSRIFDGMQEERHKSE